MAKNEVEVMNFNNYEQYIVYCKQHAKEMMYWNTEKLSEFTNKVAELMKDPEFKKKYFDGIKKARSSEKAPITIGGDDKSIILSRAYLKLKSKSKLNETHNKTEESNPKSLSKKTNPNIESRRKVFEI